jgi:predicted DNA binding CopG/RHH family protein
VTKIPKFKSTEEEAEFWATHSAADYLEDTADVEDGVTVGGSLRRRVEARLRKKVISLRLSEVHIEQVRRMAEGKGFGYQTLLRMWILERLERELHKKKRAA